MSLTGGEWETSLQDHRGEHVGGLQIVLLERSGGTHPHLIGVTFQHCDATATPNDGHRPHVDRNTGGQGVVPRLAALVAEEGDQDLMLRLVGDPLPDDIVLQRRRTSHRADLGHAGELLAVLGIVIGQPQQQIRE